MLLRLLCSQEAQASPMEELNGQRDAWSTPSFSTAPHTRPVKKDAILVIQFNVVFGWSKPQPMSD